MLEIGIKAPAFTLPDQNGEMRSLADYQGQKVILYMNSRKPFVPATTRLPGRLGKYDLTYDVKFIATKEPLEIKSGKTYQRHAALDNVLGNKDYAIPKAFVFQSDNVSADGRIVYLPIYMIMFLQRENTSAPQVYKPDLEGLG